MVVITTKTRDIVVVESTKVDDIFQDNKSSIEPIRVDTNLQLNPLVDNDIEPEKVTVENSTRQLMVEEHNKDNG